MEREAAPIPPRAHGEPFYSPRTSNITHSSMKTWTTKGWDQKRSFLKSKTGLDLILQSGHCTPAPRSTSEKLCSQKEQNALVNWKKEVGVPVFSCWSQFPTRWSKKKKKVKVLKNQIPLTLHFCYWEITLKEVSEESSIRTFIVAFIIA